LGKGFLTGKISEDTQFDKTDFRNVVPRLRRRTVKRIRAMVDLIGKFAKQKKATPAQIALAWVLAQKPWIVPIPGTTKLHRLEENMGAAAIELTREDLRQLETATSKISVQGLVTPKNCRSWWAAEAEAAWEAQTEILAEREGGHEQNVVDAVQRMASFLHSSFV